MRRRMSERGHLQESPDVTPDPPPTEKGSNAERDRAASQECLSPSAIRVFGVEH